MNRDKNDEGHLPASEADSELLKDERRGGGGGDSVGMPASEEEDARMRPDGAGADGRPGTGRPGTIPPPD